MTDPIKPLTPEQIAAQEAHAAKEGYLKRDAVALDQALNVILGGSPDETMSARAARWDTEKSGIKHEIGELMSEGLNLFQKDHGAKAEAGDLERATNVEHIEEQAEK